MTAKTTVLYRPDDSPWDERFDGRFGNRPWEHHCHRPKCVNELSAWTWHLSWRSALGMAWSHIRRYHHEHESP